MSTCLLLLRRPPPAPRLPAAAAALSELSRWLRSPRLHQDPPASPRPLRAHDVLDVLAGSVAVVYDMDAVFPLPARVVPGPPKDLGPTGAAETGARSRVDPTSRLASL